VSVTPASFRQHYREFSDPQAYSDFAIEMHAGMALKFLNARRWADSLDFAVGLWIAHFLAMERPDQKAAAIGGTPGQVKGIQTSKSVDKVSGSYDAASVSLDNQGFWGLTRYGLQLYKFALMMGAGGVQLGLPVRGRRPF
jgi:Protein of unknown function (DUF4054)